MAGALRCPQCGEAERLVGSNDPAAGGPDGILVQCLACGHTWPRGVRPCVSCGGTDVVDRPQTMTRTPRGNQLAVIGTRTIWLCARCDAEALRASLAHNQPVPDGYAARYRHQGDAAGPAGAREHAAEPRPRHRDDGGAGQQDGPASVVEPPPAPGSGETRQGRPVAGRSAPPRRRSAPAPPAAAPATLRQAVARSLEAGVDADPTVVVLLGARLGASTRLGELDDPQVWAAVWDWVVATWPDPGAGTGARARQTITALLGHWREQGWVTRVSGDQP